MIEDVTDGSESDEGPQLVKFTIPMTTELLDDAGFDTGAYVERQMQAILAGLRNPRTEPFETHAIREPERRWPTWLRSLVLRCIPYSLWRDMLLDEGYDPDEYPW